MRTCCLVATLLVTLLAGDADAAKKKHPRSRQKAHVTAKRRVAAAGPRARMRADQAKNAAADARAEAELAEVRGPASAAAPREERAPAVQQLDDNERPKL